MLEPIPFAGWVNTSPPHIVDSGASVIIKDLTDEDVKALRTTIDSDYVVEGDLRRRVKTDIDVIISIGSYIGNRLIRKLPVRGQRTHTNARTRRGRAVAVAGKKKATK
jgi:small subunit ribosomal protein S13